MTGIVLIQINKRQKLGPDFPDKVYICDEKNTCVWEISDEQRYLSNKKALPLDSSETWSSGQNYQNVNSGAYLCLSPEVVFVGFSDFRHCIGLLVHWALHEGNQEIINDRRAQWDPQAQMFCSTCLNMTSLYLCFHYNFLDIFNFHQVKKKTKTYRWPSWNLKNF